MNNSLSRAAPWLRVGPVAVLLLAASPEAIGGPRHKKLREVAVQGRQTGLTRVKAGSEERAPSPAVTAEQLRRETAVRVALLSDQAIAALLRLIKITGKGDPETADLSFRLAEHYRERMVQARLRARALDEKIFRSATGREKRGLKARQRTHEQRGRGWMHRALETCQEIAREPAFAGYRRMDEVLTNLAHLLGQAGKREGARAVFRRLIRNFPRSRYIPDATLSFAEYTFSKGKMEEALRLYEQVGKYRESPLYGYSLYKQGWCWLNLQDPRRALEMFVRLIKETEGGAGAGKSRITLIREARKDAVRAYSRVGAPGKACAFFRRIGGAAPMKMLELLAQSYHDQGKFSPAIQVTRKLMALAPRSQKLCAWQFNILRSTLSTKHKQSQLREARRLAAVYRQALGRGALGRSALAQCRAHTAGVLSELATTWHGEAQKTLSHKTYALARQLYRDYLDLFPGEQDAEMMQFYLAELLFTLERWQPCGEAYTRVVKMNNLRGEFLKESAYAAVVCWENALHLEDETATATARERHLRAIPKVVSPRPIPPGQLRLIEAIDRFIKLVPGSDELVSVMYRKARVFYLHDHHEAAIKIFTTMVVKHPGHELSIYAANLLLSSLDLLKQHERLARWVDRLQREPRIARGKFLAQLGIRELSARWKLVEHLQRIGRFRECGEAFSDMANEHMEDVRWPEMIYNAALCYEAAKLIGMAIRLRSKLIKAQPDHPLAQRALYMVAANYHALAWYSRAAARYEQFARRFHGEREAPEALQNAIVFRLGRGEYDQALTDARLFSRKFGTRPGMASRAAAVNFSLGVIHEQRREPEKEIRHYQEYLQRWGSKGGRARQILAHYRIGRRLWETSCPVAGVNGACIKIRRVRSRGGLKRHSGRRPGGGQEVRTQCGPATKMRVTLLRRSPARSRRAQVHFRRALKLYRRGGRALIRGAGSEEERSRREADARHAAAASLFYQAERLYEDFLAVSFPRKLDFSSGNQRGTERAFNKYMKLKASNLVRTQSRLEEVIKLKVPHWAIAAVARGGQLYQHFADSLYTASIPRPKIPGSLRTREQRADFMTAYTDAYCEALERHARPLEDKALQGLRVCLSKSTELSWYNEWSSLCEKELNQIRPGEFPLAAEIRARPGYVSIEAQRAGTVDKIN